MVNLKFQITIFLNLFQHSISGDYLKFNSKVLGILIVLSVIAITLSAAGASDLANNEFSNENFAINVPDASNFNQNATTDLNISDLAMKIVIFENSGNNSKDVSSIMYLKDSSANKTMVADFIKDLKENGKVVEEKDNYTVLKMDKSNDLQSAELNDTGFDELFNMVGDVFSLDDGINISDDGNNVSISKQGLNVADKDGNNVSISSKGIDVSANSSSENESVEVHTNINSISNFKDSDYAVYIKNPGNDQLIIVCGDNLELLKTMAKTASFKGK